MVFALQLTALVAVLELLLWLPPIWKIRKYWANQLLTLIAVSSVWLVAVHYTAATLLLLILGCYRFFNMLRVVRERMHEDYLKRVTRTTGLILILLQLAVCAIWWLTAHYRIAGEAEWLIVSVAILVVSLVLFFSTVRHVRTTRPPATLQSFTDRDLPSLTVAVPARNETDDLEQCLRTLIASDYPKMEILVLDDSSQNRRTPEIIRSFAHDGVRFIEGKEIRENWLAKNQAYQQLMDEATGEYILFCGVDVRFEAGSLRALVSSLLQKKKSMISVMPKNIVSPASGGKYPSLIQPMRYAWELSLPRRFFRRPPVLSSCWLINRKSLESAGGFAAVGRSVVPESYFARTTSLHDGYSFMRSNDTLGITSTKKTSDQLETMIRTRYPQVHRRPEQVAMLTIAEGGTLVLPFVLFIVSLFQNGYAAVQLVTLLAIFALVGFYTIVASLTYQKPLPSSIFVLPIAGVVDIAVMNYSMFKYEFSEVFWKGRNVSMPVIHGTTKSTT